MHSPLWRDHRPRLDIGSRQYTSRFMHNDVSVSIILKAAASNRPAVSTTTEAYHQERRITSDLHCEPKSVIRMEYFLCEHIAFSSGRPHSLSRDHHNSHVARLLIKFRLGLSATC